MPLLPLSSAVRGTLFLPPLASECLLGFSGSRVLAAVAFAALGGTGLGDGSPKRGGGSGAAFARAPPEQPCLWLERSESSQWKHALQGPDRQPQASI